jgi:AraC-like DNA-binding protein
MTGAGGPRGTLHFWHEGVAFVGSDVANEAHRHFTASLAFTLSRPFRARFDGGPWRTMHGMLVAPNTGQQMDARGCRVVIFQIDPESRAYARVGGVFAERGRVVDLPRALVERLGVETERLLARDDFQPEALWSFVLGEVQGFEQPLRLDRRVARVLELLKGDLSRRTDVPALAAAVGLSPSRVVHLFNAQVGTSLRRYVLWLRLRHVVFCLAAGQSLTAASHDAGFADSAHLCRTFRSMFGLPLSTLFRSPGVQVVVTPPTEPPSGPHAPQDRQRWAIVAAERARRRSSSHAA